MLDAKIEMYVPQDYPESFRTRVMATRELWSAGMVDDEGRVK